MIVSYSQNVQLRTPCHCGVNMVSSVTAKIADDFDGGNIQSVNEVAEKDGTVTVNVRIKPDPYTELEAINHMQYFAFQSTVTGVSSEKPQLVTYVIENASKVSYPVAWTGTTVFYTSRLQDSDSWKRNLGTQYRDGKLTWSHEHAENGSVYFSYFPPFTREQHNRLVNKCRASELATVETLGTSLDGRDIECISAGSGDRVCWIIHRQHPGRSFTVTWD